MYGPAVVDRAHPDGPGASRSGPLRGISEIRSFFRTNETPVYFVSATAFNLLGIDRWVRNFKFLNYYDSFDGTHPNVVRARGADATRVRLDRGDLQLPAGPQGGRRLRRRPRAGGKAAFLMFDEETEAARRRARPAGRVPAGGAPHRLDSKIETTRLGDEAGVPSVPNTHGPGERLRRARGARRRRPASATDLVVQTPYGDSGQTTFFIADEGRLEGRQAKKIVGQDIKVMQRIDPRECAIEGVITRHGTLVGPLMAELTGFPELTPYGGGWCGNDVFRRRADRGAAPARAGAHARDGRAAAAGGLPRLLRARLPRRRVHAASCTWAS